MPDLDWSEMEGLFCQQAPIAPTSQSGVLSFRLGGQDNSECDKKRKEPTEVKRLFFFYFYTVNKTLFVIFLFKNSY